MVQTGITSLAAMRAAATLILSVLSLSACLSTPAPDQEVQRRADLERFYSQWRNVSYQYGGSSQAGMDCSALTQRAYRDLYGLKLPRTTADQSGVGKRVPKRKLRAGDLVFFKTGMFTTKFLESFDFSQLQED